MKLEDKKKEKNYRKEETMPSSQGTHRGIPQMCPKYLTKNNFW